jgi:arylsulfatase
MSSSPRIGRRAKDADPSYFAYPQPPEGAPNVVMIVLDDVGFGQLGCFGSDIATPNIDALARGGLRYNRFHVTSICSSTRACLLTGRNHHAVGVGLTQEGVMGFPGYTGRIPKSAATLARVLRDTGYSTFAVGKWHLAARGEYSASGPMDRWPLGLGFERFYGFLGAETSQWVPELVRDNSSIEPPRTPAEGYHLSEDLADQAIRMVQNQTQATPGKPFFCYFATGAAHAPHHVAPEWVEPYRGAFDDGWEAWRARVYERQLAEGIVPAGTTLTERPSWVPSWETLTPEDRTIYARYMEVFAGFVTHADAQIGRFVEYLREIDVLDNTLLLVLSDNGASAEGGPTGNLIEMRGWANLPQDRDEARVRLDEIGGHTTFNHYPWGWAWAGNSPMRLWKRYAWLGGVRTPLIVHWPRGVHTEGGAVRQQFCHAVDMAPTIMDAIGVEPPVSVDGITQQRIDGASLVATFDDGEAPSPRATQYFEMHGSRSIYHNGWKATTNFVSPLFGERESIEGSHDIDDDHWALFDLENDFSEARDLSAEHPERVRELQELWWFEAGRNQVLPLNDDPSSRLFIHPGPYPAPARAVYRPGGDAISESQIPAIVGGFRAVADVEIAAGGRADGVICAIGDLNEGWSFYLLDGHAVAVFSVFGHVVRVASPSPVGEGSHAVEVSYRPGEGFGGPLTLSVDGEVAATGALPMPPFFAGLSTAGVGMLVGRDHGLPFCDDYEPPFPFTATLRTLTIETLAPPTAPDARTDLTTALRSD